MVAIHTLHVHIIKFNYVKLVQLKLIWDTVPTSGLQIMLHCKLQLSNASNLHTKIKNKYW